MTDIPIIFSASMVLALLREVEQPGTGKTQTRRLLYSDRVAKNGVVPVSTTFLEKHRPPLPAFGHYFALTPWHKVKAGDRLYVRESYLQPYKATPTSNGCIYRADGPEYHSQANRKHNWGAEQKWYPSIHCPRTASRLTLIVTGTKIERLQDISEADAKAEGAELEMIGPPRPGEHTKTHRAGFVRLWCSLHGTESWLNNPWVVRVAFKLILANIDSESAQIFVTDEAIYTGVKFTRFGP